MGLLLVGGAASAQMISPDKTQLTFTAPVGGGSGSQMLTITSQGGAALLLNLTTTTFGTGNWLSVSPNVSATPVTAIVSVNASSLAQGTYNGSILISATVGATNSPVSVGVTLTVGNATASSALATTPTSLTFSAQAGGLVPTSQSLNVASNPSGLGFSIAASTTDAYNWLQVQPSAIATAPAALNVLVNTAGMPVGSYTGTITLTPSSGTAITVPVSLNLTSGTSLVANVSSLQFYYQSSSALPTPQGFIVSSGNSPVNIAVTTSTTDGRAWLSATPSFATTPQVINVSALASNLPAGLYTGKVHISAPTTANGGLDIPVSLTVSSGALLTIGTSPTTFVYQTGTAAPAQQMVTIGSSSGSLNFTLTTNTSDGTNWLAASPSSGTTPQAISIGVTPGSLAPGNYSGTVTVSAPAASNSPVTIPISLSVNNTSTLTLSVQSINLNYQIGGTNQVLSQSIRVDSTGQPVQVSASAVASTCGAAWLQVSPVAFTTPTFIQVVIDPLGMNLPQTCTGTILLAQAGASSPIQIPVMLNVSQNPLFNVTPLSLNFTVPFDSDPTAPQIINLSVTDNSAVTFTATATTNTGVAWLQLTPTSGSTPRGLSVTANPNGLGAGVYTGTISITSPSLAATQQIPVTLKITPTANAVASPQSLSFTQVAGGPAPASQNVTLTSSATGGLSYLATVFPGTLGSSAALSVNPISGMTPSAISVSVNGSNLAPGTYSGSVVLTIPAAGNNPLTIPITLTVTAAPTGPAISATPQSLSFSYQPGSPAPPSQPINVTLTGGASNVVASVNPEATWLNVAGPSGTAPLVYTVSVNPAGLSAGSYNGAITLTSPGTLTTPAAAGSPIAIQVRLDVFAGLSPSISEVSNAASGVRGVISPGEIVTIKGNLLGPAGGASLRLKPDGSLETTVAGTRVFFDDVLAPILYTSPGQINTIVPYEVATRRTVQVSVDYNGVRSDPFTLQTGVAAPGIFTATQNGSGQGAVLNQDNSLNGSALPAARGSIIQVFATGEGVTQPAAVTGSVTQEPHLPVAGVTATIDGLPAVVLFAGAAPQAVAGLFQVNLRVPQGVVVGNATIRINVGGIASQPGVTVAIR